MLAPTLAAPWYRMGKRDQGQVSVPCWSPRLTEPMASPHQAA